MPFEKNDRSKSRDKGYRDGQKSDSRRMTSDPKTSGDTRRTDNSRGGKPFQSSSNTREAWHTPKTAKTWENRQKAGQPSFAPENDTPMGKRPGDRVVSKPTFQNYRGASRPSSQSDRGASRPSSQNDRGAQRPSFQNDRDAQRPSRQNDSGPSRPSFQSDRGSSRPSSQNDRGPSRPSFQNDRDASRPSFQNDRGPSRPSFQNDRGPSKPSFQSDRGPSKPSFQNDRGPSKPSFQSDRGPSRPSFQNDRGPSRPSFQNGRDASRPSFQNDRGPSRPAIQNDRDPSRPAIQSDRGAPRPNFQNDRGPSRPSFQNERDFPKPSFQNDRGPSRPSFQNERDFPKPSFQSDRDVSRPSFQSNSISRPSSQINEQDELQQENLLVGRNPIREAIKSGRDIEKLMVAKGDLSGSAREIIAMARDASIVVQAVERVHLNEIAPNHQGMIAFASAFRYAALEEIYDRAKQKEEDLLIVVLDGITDPHNVGAMIRSAECAGAHGVILPNRRAAGLTPAAVKASAGAVEHLPVARVTNISRLLETLKSQGLWVVAADTTGETYTKTDLKGPMALVIGAEGSGISRLVLAGCDKRVALPIHGKIDSLNASVACGILLYEIRRQRG